MIALLGIAAAVAAATFFAASERMLLSAGRVRLQRWVLDTVRGSGWASARFGESPGHLLGPIRAGHAVAVAAAAVLMAATMQRFAGGSAWVVALVVTLILGPLLFGAEEVVSGRFVDGGRDRTSASTIRILSAGTWIFGPISRFADRIASLIFQYAGGTSEMQAALDQRGLELMLVEGEREGLVESGEREIISGVFEFGRTRVEDIMTPVSRVVDAGWDATIGDITTLVRRTGFSRIPIRGPDSVSILGMVHVFDLFGGTPEQRPAARPVVHSSPGTRCDTLLLEMKRRRCHLAVISDDAEVVGMVTLEDLVEELVGDIRDEHDTQPEPNRRAFVVDGQVPITEINSARGVDLPTDRAETVAGFVIARLGRIPKVGDVIVHRGWTLDVLDATPQRVRKVRFRRRTPFPAD